MNKYDEAIAFARDTGSAVHGDQFVVLPETVTTMVDAANAIKHGAWHGYNVIANRQTGGVGAIDLQTGKPRQWASLDGNLLLSRVVGIRREQGEHERHMEWIAGLAAGEVAVQTVSPNANLFWHLPNDLWQQREDGGFAKLAGFIVPLDVNKEKADRVVLGVGVNIQVAPPVETLRAGSLATSTTSMRNLGSQISTGDFLEQFESRFEKHLTDFREHGFGVILERMGYAKPGSGGLMTLRFKDSQSEVTGGFAGFDTALGKAVLSDEVVPIGNLLLKGNDGAVRRYPTLNLNLSSPIPRP